MSDSLLYQASKDPYRRLMAAILLQAVNDWQKLATARRYNRKSTKAAMELARSLGYKTPRHELLDFFHSKWCEGLCAALDIDYATMCSKVRIPKA